MSVKLSNAGNFISVRGAREHNLKNINVLVPKNQLVVLTGLSGSGKSSFAFDTLYAEGQRRYVESLSSYARQFLGIMKKPEVEAIEGLSPAISIDQKTVSHNPRSTVGTITEIYDYLRLLFARVGHPHCPNCGREISRQSVDQIVNQVQTLIGKAIADTGTRQVRLMILSSVVRDRKGEYSQLLENIFKKGFQRVRIDGFLYGLDEDITLIKTNKHSIDVVVDRLSAGKTELKDKSWVSRLHEAVESALKLSNGLVVVSQVMDAAFAFPEKPEKMQDHLFSEKFACPICNLSLAEIEPRLFSFNTPHGACEGCHGLGSLMKIDPKLVVKPKLSVTEGGILPFSRMLSHDTWWFRVVAQVAKRYGFSLRVPLKNLKDSSLKVLLYGTQLHETFPVSGYNHEGRAFQYEAKYEGVIPNLERRYQETQSDFIRSEIEKFMRKENCPICKGSRLKKEALTVTIANKNIVEVCQQPINEALKWCHLLTQSPQILSHTENQIAQSILKELINRLSFLVAVGLDYLTIDRAAATLAGGEAQRIRLASQIGTGLSGVLYVLDEPSIGLHQRDNQKLIHTLKRLRDLGNTVIVVEHDREMMEESDHIIDFGPLAGEAGGQVVAQGSPNEIKKSTSLTGQYLSGKKRIHLSQKRLIETGDRLTITGCLAHNLKNITVDFPLGRFICVTGVSGSGKSTLIHDTLYHALATQLNPNHSEKPGSYRSLFGLEKIRRVSLIDQSPIGRTPRSNAATYTKAFDHIRNLFSQTREAKIRGYKPGRFSFNVKGGRCEACQGEGQIKIEMQFLPDIYVECEVCQGKRYNSETLEVTYKDKNIAEILDLSVEEALNFMGIITGLETRLKTLYAVGLGYIKLGQPAPTLSGGEAQRVKLAAELAKQSRDHTIYLLDEPTTGLHFADMEKLILVLQKLVDKGNTAIVIEHNLDFVKSADWIIDLGPEGGEGGGEVIACGTPEEVSQNVRSYTGRFLKPLLQ